VTLAASPTASVRLLSLLNPLASVADAWRNRELIWQLSITQGTSRYRGSVLGILWSFLIPLVMIVAYTFVFSMVFRARWRAAESESPLEFGVALYCGLILFNVFAEVVGQCPHLIRANTNYVKRIAFPLQILPIVTLNASLLHAFINAFVLLAVVVLVQGGVATTAIFAPIALLPLLPFTLGIAWLVASLSVYVRDLGHAMQLILQLLFFTTPIFYPLSIVPEPIRTWMSYSPLAVSVETARNALLFGQMPNGTLLEITTAGAVVVMLLGYAFFMKTKRGFADVL
jgi:lipopolysaccharide transport system permease protein